MHNIFNSLLHFQLGIINTIRVLLSEFNPIDHLHVWNEFNILEICLCFMIQNLTTAMDIHVQIGLIEINTKLLSGNLLFDNLLCICPEKGKIFYCGVENC